GEVLPEAVVEIRADAVLLGVGNPEQFALDEFPLGDVDTEEQRAAAELVVEEQEHVREPLGALVAGGEQGIGGAAAERLVDGRLQLRETLREVLADERGRGEAVLLEVLALGLDDG